MLFSKSYIEEELWSVTDFTNKVIISVTVIRKIYFSFAVSLTVLNYIVGCSGCTTTLFCKVSQHEMSDVWPQVTNWMVQRYNIIGFTYSMCSLLICKVVIDIQYIGVQYEWRLRVLPKLTVSFTVEASWPSFCLQSRYV